MPTIIDALVVTLGLDPAGFKKGQAETDAALKKTRENTSRHTKEIESDARRAAAGFRVMRNEVLGLVGISLSLSGAARMIERITTSDAAAGRLAKNIGATTKELSTWQNLAAKFGSSPEEVAGAFRRLNELQQNLLIRGYTGVESPLARLLGSDFAQFMSRSATVMDRMRLLQKAVANATNPQLAQGLLAEIGLGEGMFTMFREIGDGLDNLLKKQGALNSATERDKELAIERQQAWSRLLDIIDAGTRRLLNDFITPELKGIIKGAESGDRIGAAWEGIKSWATTPHRFLGWLWDTVTGKPRAPEAPAAPPPAAAPRSGPLSSDAKMLMRGGITPQFLAASAARETQGASLAANIADLQREIGRQTDPVARGALVEELQRLTSGAYRQAAGSKTEVNIGTLQVNTSASTGAGIAQDIASALRRQNYSLATHSASGTK